MVYLPLFIFALYSGYYCSLDTVQSARHCCATMMVDFIAFLVEFPSGLQLVLVEENSFYDHAVWAKSYSLIHDVRGAMANKLLEVLGD